MPDEYDLTLEDVAAQLERIERRLDNMGQRIAYLEGSLGQRVAFLEGAVWRPRRDASVPSKMPMSADAHKKRMKVLLGVGYSLMAVNVLLTIYFWFFLPG